MQSLFEMLIGVGTSLVATGIGVLAAWLWSRKKQDDESTNRIHRLEILVESLSERADNLIENLGIKFDNLAKFVSLSMRDFEQERERDKQAFEEYLARMQEELERDRELLQQKWERERELLQQKWEHERELRQQEWEKNRNHIVKAAALEALKVLEASRTSPQSDSKTPPGDSNG